MLSSNILREIAKEFKELFNYISPNWSFAGTSAYCTTQWLIYLKCLFLDDTSLYNFQSRHGLSQLKRFIQLARLSDINDGELTESPTNLFYHSYGSQYILVTDAVTTLLCRSLSGLRRMFIPAYRANRYYSE